MFARKTLKRKSYISKHIINGSLARWLCKLSNKGSVFRSGKNKRSSSKVKNNEI